MPIDPSGFAVVDKEPGWTSHDVVAKARGILRTRKIGHAGTLDPDATGVLVLGVGRATKLLRYCSALGKSYVGEVVFGVETSTLDAAGQVVARHDMSQLTFDQVEAAASRFIGAIEQIPPMVSAIKVDGVRLHELARQGIEIERKARPVTISQLEASPLERDAEGHMVVRVEVTCTSGTYIRSLAADLGHALGGGAHLRALRRTAVGGFGLGGSAKIDDLTLDHVKPAVHAMAQFGLVTVDDETAAMVRNGRVLPVELLGVMGDGPWPICSSDGSLLAMYEPHRGATAKPSVVLAQPSER